MLKRILSITALMLAFGSIDPAIAQTRTADKQAARAQRLFLQCQSCHEITDSKIVKSGPNLKGVFGRKVASLEGYQFSASLKMQSFTWDEAQLDKWLTQPTRIAPGTSMAFIGFPKPEDRKAMIAYLKAAQ